LAKLTPLKSVPSPYMLWFKNSIFSFFFMQGLYINHMAGAIHELPLQIHYDIIFCIAIKYNVP